MVLIGQQHIVFTALCTFGCGVLIGVIQRKNNTGRVKSLVLRRAFWSQHVSSFRARSRAIPSTVLPLNVLLLCCTLSAVGNCSAAAVLFSLRGRNRYEYL